MPGNKAHWHLLPLLRDVDHVRRMTLADWDLTLRLARQARLLGTIAHRVAANSVLWRLVPPEVQGHLCSALVYADHRARMVRLELGALASVIPSSVPVVLLKGAAYVAEAQPFAAGRLPGDVDIMVPRDRLDEVERALLDAGWKFESVDDYDQQYYRQWSHELPPMRYPGHALEVDLHHTITPVTSRTRADTDLLFRDVRAVTASRYLVLSPADQIVHAVIHLFQDSELDVRLRDLVDIDALLRTYMQADADWCQLATRAQCHGASGLLAYALKYCGLWLGTPVREVVAPPMGLACRGMDWLMSATMLPHDPDTVPGLKRRMGGWAAQVRYHRLRMPPGLLIRHLSTKMGRQLAHAVRFRAASKVRDTGAGQRQPGG
ncbi:MAG: nucleotidyltransferase family protein [Parazoarcus communis]